jgi:hypothetical protein
MTYDSNDEEHRQRNREYQRKWLAANREKQNARVRNNDRKYRAEIREYLNQIKAKGCVKCGENHLACLDFHHLDPSEKEISISVALAKKWSLKRIKVELEKCEVICSNCHRKLHWEQRRVA